MQGRMLSRLGAATHSLDVPKQHHEHQQHCEHSLYGNLTPSDAPHRQELVVCAPTCIRGTCLLPRNIQQGSMLSTLGAARDVPKQYCEPSLHGNLTPSDAPHTCELDGMYILMRSSICILGTYMSVA